MSTAFVYGQLTTTGGILGNWQACIAMNASTDQQIVLSNDLTYAVLGTGALGYVSVGVPGASTLPVIEQARGAKTFPTPVGVTTAGQTVVWTPSGTGKKFCVMGGTITVAGTLAAAAAIDINLNENGGATFWAASVAVLTTFTTTVIPLDFGHGYLASAADATLRFALGTTLTAGKATISVWGVELVGIA